MLRPGLVAALLVLVLLAGCSGSPHKKASNDPADQANFDQLGLHATDKTGVIRGVVFDEAIKPVANATVNLTAGTTAAGVTHTGADGAFGFSDLEPGTYFLHANKTGFIEVQQSAEVE